jgi:hypothetical protein
MYVGALKIRLLVREARSLKDKRQVVRSIVDRLRHEFAAAVAEVDDLNDAQSVVLGISLVGPAAKPLRDSLQRIADALRRHPVAELVRSQFAVVSGDDFGLIDDLPLRG